MNFKILSQKTNSAISVIQFISDDANTFQYICGDDAIQKKMIEISEVDNQGRVNDIIIKNKSDEFIFFSDGDILIGLKQNRVINASILIAPHSENIIPVSCIQRGRWNFETDSSKKVDHSEITLSPSVRGIKIGGMMFNPKTDKSHYANQQEVWNHLKSYNDTFKVGSASENFEEFYFEESVKVNDELRNFEHHPTANGLAVYFEDKFMLLDHFNRADICSHYFPKIIRSSILEKIKIQAQRSSAGANKELSPEYFERDLTALFEDIEGKNIQGNKAATLGTEYRFKVDKKFVVKLSYEMKNIHASVTTIL